MNPESQPGLLQRRGVTAGIVWALASMVALLAGIAWDAARHASGHAHTDERFLEWSNPGHVLAALALVNLAAALVLIAYTKLSPRMPRRLAMASLVLVALVAAGYAFALLRFDAESADHAASESADGHGHGAKAVLPENAELQLLEELTFHEPANPQPVTRATLDYAEEFLAKAREGTAKYKDINVARRERYLQITQDIPLIGAHFVNPRAGEEFDPAKPPILLYRQNAGNAWELVGVAYALPKAPGVDLPPRTPLGGLASWHYHTNLCFSESLGVLPASKESDCKGQFVAETPWLLHAWIWLDSPEGVFHHANSLLQ